MDIDPKGVAELWRKSLVGTHRNQSNGQFLRSAHFKDIPEEGVYKIIFQRDLITISIIIYIRNSLRPSNQSRMDNGQAEL